MQTITWCWLLLLIPFLAQAEPKEPEEFFEMRVRPVLAKNCFTCHTATHLGGLEMKSREAFLKGGASGPAVVPGDPEHSLLIQAVSYTHGRLKMPPSGKLADQEIQDLVAWVKAGAVWPQAPAAGAPKTPDYIITPEQRQYWAFQPVRKTTPPEVKSQSWVRSPVDRFILARLEAKSLRPVRPADKRVLIRRAYFDLIGLPPKPEDVDAFLADRSPDAFAKVVDRLLASPHYGERWGRYWLDIARYSDDRLNSTQDDPYPDAFRYRDWVVKAFNDDMPYDLFVKAQIAGDLLPEKDRKDLVAGLGFYSLSPEFQDDRVDVTTRGFLALTVACAQCHDHKFDPIPTKDYYSLLGVFMSTQRSEWPLAPEEVVTRYKNLKKKVDDQNDLLQEFIQTQSDQLGTILASRTASYMMAARAILHSEKPAAEGLDRETLDGWVRYLKPGPKEHPYLNKWDELERRGASETELRKAANEFQTTVLSVIREKKSIEEQNLIRLGGSKKRNDLSNANLLSLSHHKYILWRDLFQSGFKVNDPYRKGDGFLYYGDGKIDRFLSGEWKAYLDSLRADLAKLKSELPEQYPFLHTIKDVAKPFNERLHIRGAADNLGEEIPRHFLSILSDGPPAAFQKGSGRLELAQDIADPKNPLTARVMVNRIWQYHFGAGIVRTPSNFGQLGDRPSHPELLDYLAARFVENKWSIKAMHREIMLSATYALSAESSPENYAADPDNRLVWHANRRRLDAEALRDSLLFISGQLDPAIGGPPKRMDDGYDRRTLYAFVSRRTPDATMELFDFPNPNETSEKRIPTSTPLQGLYFLNSNFVIRQAAALASRVDTESGAAAKIRKAYRLIFDREPSREELDLGLSYVSKGGKAWGRYTQALLSSNEFQYVN